MEVQFKRNHKESYMILEADEYEENNYEERMLKENQVMPLLSFYTMKINDKMQFWYDITGKQSLQDYIEQEELDINLLHQLCLYLCLALEEIHKYLLDDKKIYFNTKTIYITKQGQFQLYLCYCPFTFVPQESSGFSEILEAIISNMNHTDDKLAELCYQLYELSVLEGTTIYEIHDVVKEYMAKDDRRCFITKEQDDVEKNCFDSEDAWIQDEYPFYESEKRDNKTNNKSDKKSDKNNNTKNNKNYEEELYYKSNWEILYHNICEKGNALICMISSWLKKEKPAMLIEKNFIIEPESQTYEPTVLLCHNVEEEIGELVYQGNKGYPDILLKEGITYIGSSQKDNQGWISSNAISKRHAKITKEVQGFWIEDLNSTNGSFLNGVQMNYQKKYAMHIGDRVQFADVCYIFR